MNPLLEINPDTCIVVVGPLVSRSCLSVPPSASMKLSYQSLMLAGLEMVRLDERGRLEDLFQVDLDAASEDICATLKRQGDFDKWITYSCSGLSASTVAASSQQPPILDLLLKMQSQGCRLVYTHYDNILDAVAGMLPILPTNEDHLEQWVSGHLKGFLHIHGHYSDIDSLVLHSSAYDTFMARESFFVRLKELFRRRTLVLIGHDPDHLNPLLAKMANAFLSDETTIRNPPLFVSSTTSPLPSCFLHLPITRVEEYFLQELLVCGPESSFIIGKSDLKSML